MNSREAEQAMPLDQFIAETMDLSGRDGTELVVEAAKPLRLAAGPDEQGFVTALNTQMAALFAA